MARQMVMVKTTTGFIPVDAISAESYAKIKVGKSVKVSVTESRNLKHHRKMFALLQLVLDGQPDPHQFISVDDLLQALKVAVGHSVTAIHFGKTIVMPKSISFESMQQDQFEFFYESVIDVILKHILPHTTRQDLDKEVFSILDGRNYLDA